MKIKLFFVSIFTLLCTAVFCQLDSLVNNVPNIYEQGKGFYDAIKNITGVESITTIQVLFMTLLTTISGYLTPLIPGLSKVIKTTTFRVAVVAAIVLVVAINMGFAESWQAIAGWVFSTHLYDKILKRVPFLKTMKPEQILALIGFKK